MADLTPRAAVFLDRDGVINRSPGSGYVTRVEEFAFLPGSVEAIRDLTLAGWPLFVVSNQRGVAQALFSQADLEAITAAMLAGIAGGRIAGVQYCTHHAEAGCGCRKPARGLIDQACRSVSIDLSQSYVIGDDLNDIALGRAVGAHPILVLSGRTAAGVVPSWPVAPDRICRDLREAAAWIMSQPRP